MSRRAGVGRVLTAVLVVMVGACTTDMPATTTAPETTTTTTEVPVEATTTLPPTTTRPDPTTTTIPAAQWRPLASMPTPRSELPGALIGSLIYVPGGFVETPQGPEGDTTVEAYDPETDQWAPVADLPEPRHHLMAAAHDGRLFVFGGYLGRSPTATVWQYRPDDDAWTVVAPMPLPVAAAVAVTVGEFVYVIGGIPEGDTVLRYNPAGDEWERLGPMPTPREHLAAAELEGLIYVLGGRWMSTDLTVVEIFDPQTGTWSSGPSLNRARSGFGAAVWRGRLVAAGGELISDRSALSSVEMLGPEGWEESNSLPVPLHGMAVVSDGQRLFVLGGSRQGGAVLNHGDAFVWQ